MVKLTRQDVFLIGGGVLLFSSGGVGGFFFAKKRLEKELEVKYADISDQEIAEAKQFYSVLNKKDSYETPEAAAESLGLAPIDNTVEDAAHAILNYQGTPEPDPESEPEVVVEEVITRVELKKNIFDVAKEIEDKPLFDLEYEISQRSEDYPFILTDKEYYSNEDERRQVSLTYFEGDDVLVDEHDRVVNDVEGTVGSENLQRFGHATKDNNMLYVRNLKKDIEFEVVRRKTTYTKEVLGFDTLKHSDHRKNRRFNPDRDD